MRGKPMEFLESRRFRFYPELLKILGYEEAIMLSHMISLDQRGVRRFQSSGKPYDGWFRYSGALVCKHLYIKCPRKQTRVLHNLARFAQTRKKGLPGVRWAFVDYAAIAVALAEDKK